MKIKGKKQREAAKYFGISEPAMRNKLSRGSLSAEDLIKFADFLECELSLIDDKHKITFDLSDLRDSAEEENDSN